MIRKILVLTLFFQILYSNDYIKLLSGKESYGILEKVQETSILFKIEGSDFAQRIPLEIIVELKLEDGSVPDWFIEIEKKNKIEYEKKVRLEERVLKIIEKRFNVSLDVNNPDDAQFILQQKLEFDYYPEECLSNSNLNVVIIDIDDDKYGVTSSLKQNYILNCFNIVDNYEVYEFIHENDFLYKFDDYILRKIGKNFNADIIVYGYSYLVKYDPVNKINPLDVAKLTQNKNEVKIINDREENIFGGVNRGGVSTGATAMDLTTVFDNIAKSGLKRNIQKNLQSLDEAGTYIYLTAFEIDISTGFKSFTSSNEVFSKIK